MLEEVTPLILAYNEEVNIARVLRKLSWAREVVVLDSGSTDSTLSICAQFPNVRVTQRPFDNHAAQWNYGLKSCDIRTEWVLAMDADYVLEDQLISEIQRLQPDECIAGYQLCFKYCINGRPLSGTLYPAVTALFRRRTAHYVQDGHTQKVEVAGKIEGLTSHVLHDDRKPLSRWLEAQIRYAQLEAQLLIDLKWRDLCWPDRLRSLLVITPWLVPLYCLLIGKGLLDGKAGFYYAMQRGMAELMLSLYLMEYQISGQREGRDQHE